jgi:hypothetical protein
VNKTVQEALLHVWFRSQFFPVLCLIADDDEDRMSDEMAGLGLASGEDAAASEVTAPPAGVPSLNIPDAAIPSGAGGSASGSKGGESVAAVPAHLIAPTAREVIHAAGARIASLGAGRAAIPVAPDFDMHDSSAKMPACHSFRQWMTIAIVNG